MKSKKTNWNRSLGNPKISYLFFPIITVVCLVVSSLTPIFASTNYPTTPPITPPTETPTPIITETPTPTVSPSISPTPTATPSPTPTPLLRNGSFEIDQDNNGLPDLWTSKKLDINDRLDTAIYYDGAKSFRFSPSDGTRKEQLYQTLNFTGNSYEEVRLDFYNQSDGNVTMGKLSVIQTVTYQDARQETSSAILPYNTHSWKKKSLVIISDEPYSQIKVQYVNTNINTNYRIDAASLTIAPAAKRRGVRQTGNELSVNEIASLIKVR